MGGVPSPLDLDEKLISVSTSAAKTVGGEFVSIDVLEHPSRGYVINEINDVPEFKGFMSATGINVAEKLVDYVVANYGK